MDPNDIDLPAAPENINLSDYDGDDKYRNNSVAADFQNKSSFPLQMEVTAPAITDKDLDAYGLDPVEKLAAIEELADCSMYLKNIHKGFSFVGSTNSLIKLVMAGIGVHKHRRAILKEIKGNKNSGKLPSFDENGNIT